MSVETCRFETDRLSVAEWHAHEAVGSRELAASVSTVLTPRTTAALPPEWQGGYDRRRAEAWITERDAEGPTLLAVERPANEAAGLVVLHEEQLAADASGAVDLRLGYVLAESAWGRGLATELVAGWLAWCRTRSDIAAVTAGVAAENLASVRVLEKTGFHRIEDGDRGRPAPAELVYRVTFRR